MKHMTQAAKKHFDLPPLYLSLSVSHLQLQHNIPALLQTKTEQVHIGPPLYVIIYSSYKLLKTIRYFGPTCT